MSTLLLQATQPGKLPGKAAANGNRAPLLACWQCGSTQEDEMASTFCHQPVSHFQTQPPQTSCDQVSGIGMHIQFAWSPGTAAHHTSGKSPVLAKCQQILVGNLMIR